ncbi:MAG TPA: TMEM165/GDT1 family protein [Polyangiaceae bacterium]|jgi:putative Ca2+/H+ antiporter (TMEM165/GDT1 family)|nr:TMEM165/GDT1 family protein [Polyangiaceae bacterium]
MIDPRIFVTVFGVIFIAELPDKTAVAALVLATRHRPLPVFAGTALALVVQSLVAVAAGGLLSLLPARPVHIGAGLLFLVSAVFMWRRVEEEDEDDAGADGQPEGFGRAFLKSFLVVFIAEWGDLTQLGTAALAARYRAPLTIFLAASAALCVVAGLAVFLGNRLSALIHPRHTQRAAAVVFVVLGLGLLAGVI